MFTIRNYSSDEEFDLAKFMDFSVDVYDVINCPFLEQLKKLPVDKYYKVAEGFKDIDLISNQVYGTSVLAFYIQYYNDISDEVLADDTVLKLFSLDDLNSLYYSLSTQGE